MALEKAAEHGGHRQRMKEKFLKYGLDVFDAHEALELYLYYAIPRRDTNPLAHRLLNRYSTLSGVCSAPLNELMRDFGLSRSAAVWLRMLPQISEIYVASKMRDSGLFERENIKEMFFEKLENKADDCAALMLIDAKFKIKYFEDSAPLSGSDELLHKAVDLSLRHHAKCVIIGQSRCELSADSRSNILETAEKIKSTLKNMNIYLLDYFIVSGSGCVSLLKADPETCIR